jgi:transposase
MFPTLRKVSIRPPVWQPPIALSHAEHVIVSHIRRAKLFIFLRRIRHELFSAAFQEELDTIFRDRSKGHPRFHQSHSHW